MTIAEIIEEWAIERGYKYYDENMAELVARVEGFIDDQYVPADFGDEDYS